MSVRTIARAGATSYEVRWRDDEGRNRSRSFAVLAEAEQFDRAVHAWQAKQRADAEWEALPRPVRQLVAVHA